MSKFDQTLTHKGVSKPLREWAHQLGLEPGSLYNRIRKDGVERALTRKKVSRSQAGRIGSANSWWRREAAMGVLLARSAKDAAALSAAA